MAKAEVTFSDGRTAVIEAQSRAQIEAAVLEYERRLTPSSRGDLFDPLAQGATFGFADELIGAVGALPAAVQTGDWDLGKHYRGIRDTIRADTSSFAERNPGTAFAAEAAGGFLTGGLGAGRTAVRNALTSMPRLAGAGAGAGAVSGLGHSEAEDIGGIVRDTAVGGAVGGAVGLAAPPIARLAGRAATAPYRHVRALREARPWGKIRQAIERDDMTLEQVQANLRKMPEGAAIVDAGGESLQTLGRDITVQAGKARNIARALFEGRRKLAPQRIDNAVRSALGQRGEFHEAKDLVASQMREAAAPLYREAYAKPIRMTPTLRAILDRPSMRSALQEGQKLAREEGEVIGGHIQALDYAKRAIDNQIGRAIRAGEGQTVRALTRTKQALLKEMDMQVPVYARARAAYAGPKALDDALEAGRKFMREDAEITAKTISEMSPSEKEFFRMGAIREIRDRVLSKSDTANAYRAIFDSPLKRERVRALFPDNKSFAKFQRAMQGEARMFETGSKAMANSSTANKQAGVADLEMDPEVVTATARGDAVGVGMALLRAFLRRNAPAVRNEKMRDEIARMLFTANRAEQQRILRQIGVPTQIKSLDDIPLGIQGAVVGGELAPTLVD